MFLMNFTIYITTCYAFVPLWFLSLQVCGLKWSYDNFELASGGNDNKVSWSLMLFLCMLFHDLLNSLQLNFYRFGM